LQLKVGDESGLLLNAVRSRVSGSPVLWL